MGTHLEQGAPPLVDRDQGPVIDVEFTGPPDPARPIKQEWGRGWADPAERGRRLAEAHRKRGEAVAVGVQLPAALTRKRGWPKRSRAGASLSELLWALGRRGRLVLDAYLAKPGTPNKDLGELVQRTGAWVKKLKATGTWSMAGGLLVEMARPGTKLAIEIAILEDAQERLMKCDPGQAGALVKTRDQAAAMLGINVKPVETVAHEHTGQVDLVHKMAESAPREALEEFNRTGNWDEERWGLPPWRTLNP